MRKRDRWKIALVAAWSFWAAMNVFWNSSAWWWNFFMLIPPFFLAIASVLTIALASTIKQKRYLVFAIIAALISLPFYKFDISLFAAEARANAINMVVWNTRVWDDEGKTLLIDKLKSLDADIYMLQEGFNAKGEFIDAKAALIQDLPYYAIHQNADLVTLSKYPVQKTTQSKGYRLWGGFLRTDVIIDNKTISLYNIHLPVPFLPNELLSSEGWQEMQQLHAEKQRLWKELVSDINSNSNLKIIGGDFNSTEMDFSMNNLRGDARLHQLSDSGFIPTTFTHVGFAKFWRIDWVFASNDIKGRQIQQQTLPVSSDHDLLHFSWQL